MSDPQHEPTMEEILASIRKIISEDGPETAPAAPAPVPPAAPMAAAEEPDVLELTQEVAQPAPQPAPAPMPEPPLQAHDVVFEAAAPPAPADHSDIFSDHTRKAVEDTFASLPGDETPAAPVQPSAAPALPVSGASVEAVFERAVRESFEPVLKSYLSDNSTTVIEGIKPVIREWMDEHFPALLEGAVRAEVERVVKARAVKR